MEKCPYCRTILNLPATTARTATVDGVRWIIATTRRTCPGCGWTRESDRYTRAFAQREAEEAKR